MQHDFNCGDTVKALATSEESYENLTGLIQPSSWVLTSNVIIDCVDNSSTIRVRKGHETQWVHSDILTLVSSAAQSYAVGDLCVVPAPHHIDDLNLSEDNVVFKVLGTHRTGGIDVQCTNAQNNTNQPIVRISKQMVHPYKFIGNAVGKMVSYVRNDAHLWTSVMLIIDTRVPLGYTKTIIEVQGDVITLSCGTKVPRASCIRTSSTYFPGVPIVHKTRLEEPVPDRRRVEEYPVGTRVRFLLVGILGMDQRDFIGIFGTKQPSSIALDGDWIVQGSSSQQFILIRSSIQSTLSVNVLSRHIEVVSESLIEPVPEPEPVETFNQEVEAMARETECPFHQGDIVRYTGDKDGPPTMKTREQPPTHDSYCNWALNPTHSFKELEIRTVDTDYTVRCHSDGTNNWYYWEHLTLVRRAKAVPTPETPETPVAPPTRSHADHPFQYGSYVKYTGDKEGRGYLRAADLGKDTDGVNKWPLDREHEGKILKVLGFDDDFTCRVSCKDDHKTWYYWEHLTVVSGNVDFEERGSRDGSSSAKKVGPEDTPFPLGTKVHYSGDVAGFSQLRSDWNSTGITRAYREWPMKPQHDKDTILTVVDHDTDFTVKVKDVNGFETWYYWEHLSAITAVNSTRETVSPTGSTPPSLSNTWETTRAAIKGQSVEDFKVDQLKTERYVPKRRKG